MLKLADPGFGSIFTDHMVTIDWNQEQGWHDAVVGPHEPLSLDPAAAVLHYAQAIFEGLKAYRQADGGLALFRPQENAARFNRSAERLAMPALPEDLFIEAIAQLVTMDRDWVPASEGASLYVRPFMFAREAFLGVRPARQYSFVVIASPVAGYFRSDASAIRIWVSEDYTRAARGGTGAAKCSGNYAAGLVPQAQAIARGCDQTLFLDAVERKWVEELGGMNLFFVFADGTVLTPPLTGTILPGITRESVITLLEADGRTVCQDRYSLDQWREDATSRRLVECFACGTAAAITPVGTVAESQGEFSIGETRPGHVTTELGKRLASIQRGTSHDPHHWMLRLR